MSFKHARQSEDERAQIAHRIYLEMGLPAPEIIEYPSLTEAVSDFSNWKSRIKQVVPTLWDYQYPVLNPSSYWARYHLFDEGFQFDLTRTANAHGCYVYPHYLSHIPLEPNHFYGRYLAAAIDACRDTTPTPIDQAIASIVNSDDAFLDEGFWMRELEDPLAVSLHACGRGFLDGHRQERTGRRIIP